MLQAHAVLVRTSLHVFACACGHARTREGKCKLECAGGGGGFCCEDPGHWPEWLLLDLNCCLEQFALIISIQRKGNASSPWQVHQLPIHRGLKGAQPLITYAALSTPLHSYLRSSCYFWRTTTVQPLLNCCASAAHTNRKSGRASLRCGRTPGGNRRVASSVV